MPLYSQSQQEYLLNAINAEALDAIIPAFPANTTFGVPQAIAQKVATDPNTEITLRGRQGRGYIGTQTFRYTRLSLNNIFKNFVPQVTAPDAYGWLNTVAKKTAFAQNLNGRYGLNLVAEDIPDQYIYLNSENTLTVNASSVQYVGSIRFKSIKGKLNLEDQVVNDILAELNHPNPVKDQKRSATMLGYGVDFTDEPQVMTSLVNGRLDVGTNLSQGFTANLLAVMVAKGLPSFDVTGASIKRLKATGDSRANTRFDNVLVITNVDDPHVAGDWLLHYND